MTTNAGLAIAYFGHDALESTVVKRVRAFAGQGCTVTGFMFRRPRSDLRLRLDCTLVDLGMTQDRSYLRRLPRLLAGLLRSLRARGALKQADIVYARNLDMLALAVAARVLSGSRALVVYEVLDIQRPMLRADWPGRVLRAAERLLLRQCALLVVSSPDFITRYFAPVQDRGSEWCLLENKVPAAGLDVALRPARPAGPPWVIGWFGTLRCRRSFRILCALADRLGDQVHIRLGGRPSPSDIALADIEAEVAKRSNMTYLGAYENPKDLPAIYGPVHFAWCVDYTDEGANSDWLIPNRVYEGGLHGAVALARDDTATGRLVAERRLGFSLPEPIESAVQALVRAFGAEQEAEWREILARQPRHLFVDERDTADLVTMMAEKVRARRSKTIAPVFEEEPA